MKTTVTRHPNGKDPKEVRITSIHIPDLWHIAMALKELSKSGREDTRWMDLAADEILSAWHIAHDLKDHIISN